MTSLKKCIIPGEKKKEKKSSIITKIAIKTEESLPFRRYLPMLVGSLVQPDRLSQESVEGAQYGEELTSGTEIQYFFFFFFSLVDTRDPTKIDTIS